MFRLMGLTVPLNLDFVLWRQSPASGPKAAERTVEACVGTGLLLELGLIWMPCKQVPQ